MPATSPKPPTPDPRKPAPKQQKPNPKGSARPMFTDFASI